MAILSEDPYRFDLDDNGQLALTKKNAVFMRAIISNDSNYRSATDEKNINSSAWHFKNYRFSKDISEIEKGVRLIDKENSTHLAVSGREKGSNKGIEIVANKILGIENLENELNEGSSKVVITIAESIKGYNVFSFATKYCAFVSRYLCEQKDNYCIYDGVLANILPYYAWYYCGRKDLLKRTGNSNIEGIYKNKYDYDGYRKLIDDIREAAYKKYSYEVTREDFDNLLWYYYKGDNLRINSALRCINKLECSLNLRGNN